MIKTIYLAGGCFWGLEKYLSLIKGITDTLVGYANGKTSNPTYEEVCKGSDHVETVKIKYDDDIISLTEILDLYSKVIDPTSINKQGGDIGRQYRTGIYYLNNQDKQIIEGWIILLQEAYADKIQIEVLPLNNYYEAEEYHQKYLEKNKNGYCHISEDSFTCAANAIPSLKNNKIKDKLTSLQFEVAINGATEKPFDNEYYNNYEKGIYVDIVSGEVLFISTDKFESGCGWPAFAKPFDQSLIIEVEDKSYGRDRIEVRSKNSNIHLGHVFNDGKKELGGLRYCVNSASLRFIALKDMSNQGYEEYIKFIK